MIRSILLLTFVVMSAGVARAACSAVADTSLGTGVTGQVQLSTGAGKINKLMYCNGTTWMDFPGSRTATTCSINGEIRNVSGELHYCNSGYLWRWDSSALTNGTCSTNGEFRWSVADNQLQFCNGTNWRTIDLADSTPDSIPAVTTTDAQWDLNVNVIEPLRGFHGGTLTASFTSAGCGTMNIRLCSDSTCATVLTGTFLTANGSFFAPNGSYVRIAMITPAAASTTCAINYTVGSMTSGLSVTTAATDTTVAYSASFSEVRSATPSAVYESNIVRTSSHSGVTVSIGDAGSGGNPEFRICSDAACTSEIQTWGVSNQTLPPGAYIQLRTTAPSGAVNMRRVQLTAGTGASASWSVMTSTCPRVTTLASGASLTCTCPVNYHQIQSAVIGSGNYLQTSDVCAAAIHSGVVTTAAGGTITANGNTSGTPAGTCPSFTGSVANTITSGSSGAGTSMYFSPRPDQCN